MQFPSLISWTYDALGPIYTWLFCVAGLLSFGRRSGSDCDFPRVLESIQCQHPLYCVLLSAYEFRPAFSNPTVV